MITLDGVVATSVVGAVAVGVAAWGAWLSLGSSRRGPAWSLSVLERWRWMPWAIIVGGVLALLVVSPPWVGVGLVYVGVVVAALTVLLRRSLERVRDAYGEFDAPDRTATTMGPRAGRVLAAGGAILALLAIWDLTVRGWAGVFGLVLAVCLGGVGVALMRRSG